MNYYVFQVSDQSRYGKPRTAREVFDFLVREKSAWGFGLGTPNRKAIQPGDKVLFYLTGPENQVFVGAAVLKSGAYEDTSGQSKDWFLEPQTLRIDLEDVIIFSEPKRRAQFDALEFRPAKGGSCKISERDFLTILGSQSFGATTAAPEEMEFALERYLEDFIVENWAKIDFGEKLTIFKDDDGNIGQQYLAGDAGYIDLLALDKNNDFVVIELKKGRRSDEVVGQVLRYMTWVEDNLAKGKKVRGMIIVGKPDKKLEYALRRVRDEVAAKIYNISFSLEKY